MTSPGATSTADQSGPIDPNGTIIGSLLGRIDEESNGLGTDSEGMMNRLDTQYEDFQRTLLPLSIIRNQTIRLKRDLRVKERVRAERDERINRGWLKNSCVEAEKEATSIYALRKSDLRSSVRTAKGLYNPQKVDNTIWEAKNWMESPEGQLTMAKDVVTQVEEYFKRHKSEGTAPATSAQSRSWRKWTSFGRKKELDWIDPEQGPQM